MPSLVAKGGLLVVTTPARCRDRHSPQRLPRYFSPATSPPLLLPRCSPPLLLSFYSPLTSPRPPPVRRQPSRVPLGGAWHPESSPRRHAPRTNARTRARARALTDTHARTHTRTDSWSEEFTPRGRWLGGYADAEGRHVKTLDGLRRCLEVRPPPLPPSLPLGPYSNSCDGLRRCLEVRPPALAHPQLPRPDVPLSPSRSLARSHLLPLSLPLPPPPPFSPTALRAPAGRVFAGARGGHADAHPRDGPQVPVDHGRGLRLAPLLARLCFSAPSAVPAAPPAPWPSRAAGRFATRRRRRRLYGGAETHRPPSPPSPRPFARASLRA